MIQSKVASPVLEHLEGVSNCVEISTRVSSAAFVLLNSYAETIECAVNKSCHSMDIAVTPLNHGKMRWDILHSVFDGRKTVLRRRRAMKGVGSPWEQQAELPAPRSRIAISLAACRRWRFSAAPTPPSRQAEQRGQSGVSQTQ